MAAPRDGFERYYAEKLWEWIPEVYRHEDGIAARPGVLRSLVEIVAAHAAVGRRDIDRVWEDQFGEFADDWALPYIGDLVGTRLVNALNRRGRRADVAQTIFYRRRKGTISLLETLVRDIAGWDGVVVEAFRRLGRTPHRLDAPLLGPGAARAGLVTGTPPGGFADLRRARGGDLVDGPFEEYSRMTDGRQLRGHLGRFNIPKLNFHLYRQLAFEVHFVTPVPLDATNFTFDPSGREVTLFRPSREDVDECTVTEEWRVCGPLTCRLLGEARYRLRAEDIPALATGQLAPYLGLTFTEPRLRALLASVLGALTAAQQENVRFQILESAITADSPKLRLIRDAVATPTPGAVAVSQGASSTTAPVFQRSRTITASLGPGVPLTFASGKQLAIDPVRGRFRLAGPPGPGPRVFVPVHNTGLFGPLGAGSYSRRASVITSGVVALPAGALTNPGPVTGFALPVNGVNEFVNSKTFLPTSPALGVVDHVVQLALQAHDEERPYVNLIPTAGGSTWTFRADPKPVGFDPTDPANRRTLVIDGLWIGVQPSGLASEVVANEATEATPVLTTLAIDGVFDQVVIRNCSIDPGGEQARLVPTQAQAIPAVRLELVGEVEELVIENSIVGPVLESTSTTDPGSAGRIVIRDSVVDARLSGTAAIRTRLASVVLERTTVFGQVEVNRLDASEALIQGDVVVTDNQHGCVRFSAAHETPFTRLPRQFESHLFNPVIPDHVFESRRFGTAGYAQLSATAPAALQRGAENGSEIGAWSRLLSPIKLDDLKAKVAEFMPFGLIAQFIAET